MIKIDRTQRIKRGIAQPKKVANTHARFSATATAKMMGRLLSNPQLAETWASMSKECQQSLLMGCSDTLRTELVERKHTL